MAAVSYSMRVRHILRKLVYGQISVFKPVFFLSANCLPIHPQAIPSHPSSLIPSWIQVQIHLGEQQRSFKSFLFCKIPHTATLCSFVPVHFCKEQSQYLGLGLHKMPPSHRHQYPMRRCFSRRGIFAMEKCSYF